MISVPDPTTVLMVPAAMPGEQDGDDLPEAHCGGRRLSGGVGRVTRAVGRRRRRAVPPAARPSSARPPRRRRSPSATSACVSARIEARLAAPSSLGCGVDPHPGATRGLGDAGDLVDRGAEPLERLGDLGRHHPHLVGVALGDLRHHLEVLVGQQRLVGLSVVDRLEHRLDGLPLTLGLEDRGLAVGLRAQDQRLAVTLGGQDRGLLVALGGEDRRTAADPRR